MITYVDSSAALRWIFKSPGYYPQFGRWKKGGSSRLLEIECHRALDRIRLQGFIQDEELSLCKAQLENLIDSLYIFEINEAVTVRAKQNFPTVVKTLDALHLSTALLWQQEMEDRICILSHDNQMLITAKSIGLKIVE